MDAVFAEIETSKKQKNRGKSADADEVLDVASDAGLQSGGVSKEDTATLARPSCEALKMCRMTNAVVYLTFLFAVNTLSDALSAAGKTYEKALKKGQRRNSSAPHTNGVLS